MLQTFDDRNRQIQININGKLWPRDQAGISPFDSAVQGGDAVWEGLRLYRGRIFKLREHLARLRRSALALAFPSIPDDAALVEQIRHTLVANRMFDGVHIRLTLTRGVKITSGMDPRLNQSGPTLIVLAEFKPPVYDKSGIRLLTSGIRRFPPECLDQKIHSCNLLQSIMAKIQANAAGYDDALMLDLRGFVAETNATHVFVVHDDQISTSFTHSCPEGITRGTVLEICQELAIGCQVRDITLSEVYGSQEMFCTGTMGEIVPVREVDGHAIAVGPLTSRIAERFAERAAVEGEWIMPADPGPATSASPARP